MKLRILEIVGDPVGGIRKHVHSIIKSIDKENFEIFYSYSYSNKDLIFDDEIISMDIDDSKQLKLKIYKKPHFSDLINIYKLVKFVKVNNIQVIHGHGAKGGMYARILKLFTNVKTIYTPHGGVLHNSFGKIPDFIYILVEKILIPLTNMVVVESNYSKNRYIEKIGDIKEKLVLNYNGVSYNNKEKKIDIPSNLIDKNDDKIDLAIFARLHDMKGQDIAIKALQYLSDNYILNLFGNDENKELLKDLVKGLNLEQRVYFHGDTRCPEEMMKHIDIILIPSAFESFSYVAAEGLMMKKLVIANDVGGLKEVLAENSGILIENIDEYNLSNTIKSITKELETTIVLNGNKKYFEDFQESSMIINLQNIYKKFIS